MIVRTQNSTYEIDNGSIRCLETDHERSQFGITEKWRKYSLLMPVEKGGRLRAYWESGGGTVTSIIQSIIDDEPSMSWYE